MTRPPSPSSPDFIQRIREHASPLRWFILPVFAAAALFWLAVFSLIGSAIFVALSGPQPSILGFVLALVLLAFFLWPLWAVVRPFAATEGYVRGVFDARVVNDEPAWADLVAEVQGICADAGAQPVRWVCVAPEGVNACAFGLMPSRMAMVFGQGLLDAFQDSPERLRAVIAHEAGHVASGDTRISSMYVVAQDTFRLGIVRPCAIIAGFFGFSILSVGDSMNPGRSAAPDDAAGMAAGWAMRVTMKLMGLAFLCAAAAIWLAGWLASRAVDTFHCAHSRRREFMADRAGAILTSRAAMIDMLRSLDERPDEAATALPGAHPALQIVNLSGQNTWKRFRTHPTTEERIERLRSWPDLD